MITDPWIVTLGVFGLLVALGATSGVINDRLWISEPLACALAGIALGPLCLGLLRIDPGASDADAALLREAARVTLSIAVTGAAMRLPAYWLRQNWRALAVALGPGMLLMAAAGALVGGLLALPWIACVLIGAAIAPTDPVLSAPILTGQLARNAVPDALRHAMTAESGINDGLALPFVMVPILLLQQAPGAAMQDWLMHVILWQVGVAVVVGCATGWLTSKGLEWARRQPNADKASLLTVTIALALTTTALVHLLDGGDVLAAFIAGAVLNNSNRRAKVEEYHERFSEALGRFFDLPIMILFGAAIPWSAWAGMGWRGALFAAGVLLLRRLPAWMALGPLMPWTRRRSDAAFAGWFGPVGAAALYYAMLIREQTGMPGVWPAISLAVGVSVLAHGVTGTPFTQALGRRTDPEQGIDK